MTFDELDAFGQEFQQSFIIDYYD